MWPFSQRAVTREDVARWLASGRAKPIAKAIENGGDGGVRREAASALASMAAADLGQAGRSKVVDLLGGPEGDVRQAARLGAASQPQAYNVEPLFQAIEAAGEPDRDAAYDQLGKFLFNWAQLRRDFGDDLDEVAVRMAPIVRATNGNETAYDPLLTVTCKAANLDRGQNPVIDHAIRLAALGNAFVNHAVRSGNYDRLRPALRRVGILSYQDPMLEERQRLIDSMVEMLRESEGDIREKVATVIIAIFAGAEPTLAWKNL
jgi:hypothetical protein